jgi:DNA-binding transcriptional regulator YhcF (GntR family)
MEVDRVTIQEAYENLANAIIIQAVKDYRTALKDDNIGLKRNVERFFKSEYFKALTDISGEQLMKKLRTEVK